MITEADPTTTGQDEQRSPAALLQSIILEKTDGGRLIVDFLISAMKGELEDFQPCHKLQAAKLLEKFGLQEIQPFIADSRTSNRSSQALRQERRESRSADIRIRSELAQIVREETGDGRAMVSFLVKAMQGELLDFQPCHRLSASRELLHRGFDYTLENEDLREAEPIPDLAEEEQHRRREEYRRRREEAVEFSLHGPVYYDVNPWHCPCEDRLHDCEGNELTEEECDEVARQSPGATAFIDEASKLEDFKSRYEAYLTRLNPDKVLDAFISNIRWPTLAHEP